MSSHGSKFHIHGDNIVECERTLQLIEIALSSEVLSVDGPVGSAVCPSFRLHLRAQSKPWQFTLFPGFGRWTKDILEVVRKRGGTLREAADAIVTRVEAAQEEPLIAIEYCGALPAGNQAWQRNGRAYSFGLAGIPYLYVAEVGGYELGAQRTRKAPRLPNPAVPFSYLCYSLLRGTPVLPAFTASPGADAESKREYAKVLADSELIALIRAIIVEGNIPAAFDALTKKVLAFVRVRAASSHGRRTLTPDQWSEAYRAIQANTTLVKHLLSIAPLPWSKTAYIRALTNSAKELMIIASEFAIGLTSTELPMCIVPPDRRERFANRVSRLYPILPNEFAAWLKRAEPLVICWVMGFKPRGDDARPDRGLAPLTRMLIGAEHDLLTVVYGPAPASTWPTLENEPAMLVERNGLWEAVLEVSDAILVDCATDNVTNHGFVRRHWARAIPTPTSASMLVEPVAARIGENDVDTVLHTLLHRLAGDDVFEGMCNPPGGDWSGVSLQTLDRALELRWLSLPRVSGEHAKRPDHVFQIFGITSRPIILAVESKEHASAVEPRIGTRLKAYMSSLYQRYWGSGSFSRTRGV